MSARKHPVIKVGDRFRKWVVIDNDHSRRQEAFLCRCDCGRTVVVLAASLRRGRSTQCHTCAFVTHGQTRGRCGERRQRSAEYTAWSSMLTRCLNPRVWNFERYGGRGVRVFPEWIGEQGFEQFLACVGPRPSDIHSLDRYPDKNGNYEPGNVRWATPVEQARNTRRNRILTLNGQSRPVAEWAEVSGIQPGTLHSRIRKGWPVERLLTQPPVWRGVRGGSVEKKA